ncbi:hypothetical protein ALC57_18512 [Trachymyrmex cornetzi]|uniref:Uncharacterized protein n=1 Tax=Trachymyrmex cornetzi TaxID=471704 RepID=A0A151IRQ2_9HYME|nr:hypothetical protein ALC57_18512 [Trachymyrmex cornetzi]
MKVKVPYNFDENNIEGDKDVSFVKTFQNIFINEDTSTEEEEEVEDELGEHELGENHPVFDFESCTSNELIEFILDFFNIPNEEELYQFLARYLNITTAEDDKVT